MDASAPVRDGVGVTYSDGLVRMRGGPIDLGSSFIIMPRLSCAWPRALVMQRDYRGNLILIFYRSQIASGFYSIRPCLGWCQGLFLGGKMPDGKEQQDGRKSKYWICEDCAEKKKLIPPDRGVTIIVGLCGHCDCPISTTLTPIIDYRHPGKTYD